MRGWIVLITNSIVLKCPLRRGGFEALFSMIGVIVQQTVRPIQLFRQ